MEEQPQISPAEEMLGSVLTGLGALERLTRVETQIRHTNELLAEVRERLDRRPPQDPEYCARQDRRLDRLERWRAGLTGAGMLLQTEILVLLSLLAVHIGTIHP